MNRKIGKTRQFPEKNAIIFFAENQLHELILDYC